MIFRSHSAIEWLFLYLKSQIFFMKILTSLLFVFSSLALYSQQYEIVNASLSENVKIVYRGFGNKMEFKAPEKDGVRYSLTVTNAIISAHGDHYILKPGRGKMVGVNLMEIKGDIHVVAKTDSFYVLNVPDPSIYINGELATGTMKSDLKYVRVQMKPDIPLDWKFKVTGWQMLIDGELYFGQNDRIPNMVNEAIGKLKSGDQFTLKVKAEGEDGITREYSMNITR